MLVREKTSLTSLYRRTLAVSGLFFVVFGLLFSVSATEKKSVVVKHKWLLILMAAK